MRQLDVLDIIGDIQSSRIWIEERAVECIVREAARPRSETIWRVVRAEPAVRIS